MIRDEIRYECYPVMTIEDPKGVEVTIHVVNRAHFLLQCAERNTVTIFVGRARQRNRCETYCSSTTSDSQHFLQAMIASG